MSSENKDTTLVRLSKLMSERGLCSRREADYYIEKGWVEVDGIVLNQLGTKVSPDCKIRLLKDATRDQASSVTVLLNKPIGYVSAQPEKDYEPAIVLLERENYQGPKLENQPLDPRKLLNLAVCGRLDIDSQGLLIFSQDGRVAKRLIGEDSQVEKEYLVRVSSPNALSAPTYLGKDKLKLLCHGLELDGAKLKPAKVDWVNEDQLRMILTEGKKRQVRRMCELVGLRVLGLKRVRVGKVMLGDLQEGKWRYMKTTEKF